MQTDVRQFSIGSVPYGGGAPLVLFAGPCVIESAAHTRKMAEGLRDICADLNFPLVFKASFDKANRSSVDSFRGPGLEAGMAILAGIKRDFNLPVVSDIHAPEQAAVAAKTLDILQIPAFLCRQTDLLVAAGKTGLPVSIKKGQFLAPQDITNAVQKVESTGNQAVTVTERGSTFGYNNLVSDMRALPIIRSSGVPVIFDATHSVQLPGGLGNASGGDRAMAHVLARSAVAAGVDGLFLEVHDSPDTALCDGPNQIALDSLPNLLRTILQIDAAVRSQPE